MPWRRALWCGCGTVRGVPSRDSPKGGGMMRQRCAARTDAVAAARILACRHAGSASATALQQGRPDTRTTEPTECMLPLQSRSGLGAGDANTVLYCCPWTLRCRCARSGDAFAHVVVRRLRRVRLRASPPLCAARVPRGRCHEVAYAKRAACRSEQRSCHAPLDAYTLVGCVTATASLVMPWPSNDNPGGIYRV
jgi:hypothetical protein